MQVATISSARRRGARALAVAAAVAILAGSGCAGDEPESTAGSGGDGAELYQRSCASCHGTDLRGTDQGPSHLSEVYAPDHHSDASFRAAVAQGSPEHHWAFGDMAPVDGLTDDEVTAIIAYVREQQSTAGLEPYPPP